MILGDSWFLTDTGMHYAMIELELLAAVWAMSKSRHYLISLPTFTLMTDHSTLTPNLNNYSLDAMENPRLQRLNKKVSQYVYSAVWRPRKNLSITDALSRSPLSRHTFKHETTHQRNNSFIAEDS